MSEPAIVIDRLTKRFGAITAVDNISFTVNAGRVTGFLGPNGAGKTTTLRMLLGLVRPTAGTATIFGETYANIKDPLTVVGAGLEAASFHPGRTALDHLRCYAPLAGASDARCLEILELVGLSAAAKRRAGQFSLGMKQRLALALTLLGDPKILVLDEPANGLDPEGMRWLREFLRHLASQGKTVLISSHLLGEVQQSVDDVVIVAGGQLKHASPIDELANLAERRVQILTPDADRLAALASSLHWRMSPVVGHSIVPGTQEVLGVSAHQVGAAAFQAGVELHSLTDVSTNLEDVFLSMTTAPTHQMGVAA